MLLFVYVFGGAIHAGSGHYVNYLLPGILLITIAMGISYTAIRLFTDMQSGIFERFQSMPIARSSALWAHVLTSVVSNLISLVLVVLVAVLIGFRSGAGALAWLAVAGILVLFTLALTWLAVIPGLSAKPMHCAGPSPTRSSPCLSSARHSCPPTPCPARARLRRTNPSTSIINTIHDLFTSSQSAPASGSPSPGASASSSSRTPSPWPPTAARSPKDVSPSSGSVENRNDSARHGLMPWARHARATKALPIFNSSAEI